MIEPNSSTLKSLVSEFNNADLEINSDISHFNTMEDALGTGINYINCIETGLSADPLMIRRISELNKVSIISNSDSHSTNFHRIKAEKLIFGLKSIDRCRIIIIVIVVLK